MHCALGGHLEEDVAVGDLDVLDGVGGGVLLARRVRVHVADLLERGAVLGRDALVEQLLVDVRRGLAHFGLLPHLWPTGVREKSSHQVRLDWWWWWWYRVDHVLRYAPLLWWLVVVVRLREVDGVLCVLLLVDVVAAQTARAVDEWLRRPRCEQLHVQCGALRRAVRALEELAPCRVAQRLDAASLGPAPNVETSQRGAPLVVLVLVAFGLLPLLRCCSVIRGRRQCLRYPVAMVTTGARRRSAASCWCVEHCVSGTSVQGSPANARTTLLKKPGRHLGSNNAVT